MIKIADIKHSTTKNPYPTPPFRLLADDWNAAHLIEDLAIEKAKLSIAIQATLDASDISDGRAKSLTETVFSLPGIEASGVSSVQFIGNFLFYEPFFVRNSISIDRLAIEVTGTGAGSLRVGIYTADSNWQPISLFLDAGTVDCSTLGVKTIIVDEELESNRYLKCHVSDVLLSFRTVRGGSRFCGFNPSLGLTPFVNQLYCPFSFGVLPEPPSPWDTILYSSVSLHHAIFLRESVS